MYLLKSVVWTKQATFELFSDALKIYS